MKLVIIWSSFTLNILFCCLVLADGFFINTIASSTQYSPVSFDGNTNTFSPLSLRKKLGHRNIHFKSASILNIRGGESPSAPIPSPAALTSKRTTIGNFVANGLGYVMGFGAVVVYFPIVIKLLTSKSSDGLSLQTWIFNLLGLSLSVYYPFKKDFPISTYMELITVAVQSFFILFLVCFYRGLTSQYLLGVSLFSVVAVAMSIAKVPSSVLNFFQVVSILLCNYANVPQIILTVSI